MIRKYRSILISRLTFIELLKSFRRKEYISRSLGIASILSIQTIESSLIVGLIPIPLAVKATILDEYLARYIPILNLEETKNIMEMIIDTVAHRLYYGNV
jgi:hypothetical protein